MYTTYSIVLHSNMQTLFTYNYNDMTWFMNFNPCSY